MTVNHGKFARDRSIPVSKLDKDFLRAGFSVANAYTVPGTTLGDIPLLTLALRASTTYILEAWLLISQSVGAGIVGIGFGFTGTQNIGEGANIGQGSGAPTVQNTVGSQNPTVALTDNAARPIGTNAPADLRAVIQVVASGTLTVKAQRSAGTTVIVAGYVKAYEL